MTETARRQAEAILLIRKTEELFWSGYITRDEMNARIETLRETR